MPQYTEHAPSTCLKDRLFVLFADFGVCAVLSKIQALFACSGLCGVFEFGQRCIKLQGHVFKRD
jgi:hypothetical protein